MLDIMPLTMLRNGIYVSGELWGYWCDAFPKPLASRMWDFVMDGIDDERAGFVRSLAWRRPHSPI